MRYLTNLTFSALFLTSMIFSTSVFGQLTYDETTKEFNLDFAAFPNPDPVADISTFGIAPFYKVFAIYGDGNYKLLDERFQIDQSYQIPYSYEFINRYPAIMLLLERKTDTPPPPPERQSVLPDDPRVPGNDGVIDFSNALSPPPTFSMVGIDPQSHSKLTIGNDKIAIDYSHHDSSDYYMEDNKLLAFPIAYKPQRGGVVVFYYNDLSATSVNGLTYWDPSLDSSVPFGTYFPHYRRNSLESINDLKSKDNATKVSTSTLPYFENAIIYNYPSIEGTFYDPNNEELRLFHLLKSGNLEDRNYRFLAVLYDSTGIDSKNYALKKDILQAGLANELPRSFSLSQGTPELSFQDADLFEVRTGEPNDPNELVITDVSKCEEGKHLVTFKLEFCNRAEFAAAAGATIVLENISGGLLSNIKFIDTNRGTKCANLNTCIPICKHTFNEIHPGDERYCILINDPADYLIGTARCAHITLSAEIRSTDLDILWKKSVLKYCVTLHPVPGPADGRSGGPAPQGSAELCNPNFLLDTLILVDTIIVNEQDTIIYSKLDQNPVWEDRNLPCGKGIDCCQKGDGGKGGEVCGFYCKLCIFILIILLLCFFLYFFQKKKKKHKKKKKKKK